MRENNKRDSKSPLSPSRNSVRKHEAVCGFLLCVSTDSGKYS